MAHYTNPFPNDADRREIWEMLVERDIKAYIKEDWGMVADDFLESGFMGIDAGGLANPDSWQLTFPTIAAYRDEWLRQASVTASTEFAEDLEAAILRATTLRDIEISGDCAIAHKKFDGRVAKKDGGFVELNWQSLYRCIKADGRWRIAGFTGYLPHPMVGSRTGREETRPAKAQPEGASQHVTAGPYSPVLQVYPGQLVVISGQAAIDPDGNIIGDTVEEQSRVTLDNCRTQLASAGCGLEDVFKVNVYLTDLEMWGRFNQVYETVMPEPRPVRTAVGTDLLEGLLVEIEMWAVKT
jgi:enamine deaminase RidA (YjgF/YER057c/UK114 family)